jgi:hypothetical protein
MGFNFGQLFNAVTNAASSGNLASTINAVSGLQAALGTSQATLVQAQMYLTNARLAQAQKDQAAWLAACNGLVAMTAALPVNDAPLVGELGGLFNNPDMAADVIARIQASLLNHNF